MAVDLGVDRNRDVEPVAKLLGNGVEGLARGDSGRIGQVGDRAPGVSRSTNGRASDAAPARSTGGAAPILRTMSSALISLTAPTCGPATRAPILVRRQRSNGQLSSKTPPRASHPTSYAPFSPLKARTSRSPARDHTDQRANVGSFAQTRESSCEAGVQSLERCNGSERSLTSVGARTRLLPVIRERCALGGGLKSMGQRQAGLKAVAAPPALRGGMPLQKRTES
jgi:hypothetical protein